MGWLRPSPAYGHTVRQEADFTSVFLAQLTALGLRFEVDSLCFGLVFKADDLRIHPCDLPTEAAPVISRDSSAPCLFSEAAVGCKSPWGEDASRSFRTYSITRETLAPSVRCLGVREREPCRSSFPHFSAAALGAPVVPKESCTCTDGADASCTEQASRLLLFFHGCF